MRRLPIPLHLLAALVVSASVSLGGISGPAVHFPLNEGAGRDFHSLGANGLSASLHGPGGEWTSDVPQGFRSGSAWRFTGQKGSAIIASGEEMPELGNLESFTFTGWVRVHEARHLSRIISKSLPGMEALVELRLDAEEEGQTCFLAALRTGSLAPSGFAEKSHELRSEPFTPGHEWMAVALVRDSESGIVTFYLAPSPEAPFHAIGSAKGPVGPINTERADLVIGNTRLNMDRNAVADFSDFRLYLQTLDVGDLEAVRQSALKPTP